MSKGHSRAKKAAKRDPIEDSAKRIARSFGIPVDDHVREVAREMADRFPLWDPPRAGDMVSVWVPIPGASVERRGPGPSGQPVEVTHVDRETRTINVRGVR